MMHGFAQYLVVRGRVDAELLVITTFGRGNPQIAVRVARRIDRGIVDNV
jgi:hypothetical protein